MAKSIPNLQAADVAVSFALQGEMPLFVAVMREGRVNPSDIEIFTTSREYDPHISASLVFEVALRGQAPMLKHLLFTRGMTPHIGLVVAHEQQRITDEIAHLKAQRIALSQALFNSPDGIHKFGRETELNSQKVSWKRTRIPDRPLSEALRDDITLQGTWRPMTEMCFRLLKRAETQVPKPDYAPPMLISAEDYRASYEAHVARRNATRGRNLMQLSLDDRHQAL